MAKKVDMFRQEGTNMEIKRKIKKKKSGFWGFGEKDQVSKVIQTTEIKKPEQTLNEGVSQKTDWLHRLIEVCVIIAFAGIPVFFLPWGSNIFEWNKQFLLCILALVVFVAWLARAMIKKELRSRWSFFTITICVFVVVMLVATLFSVNKVNSFFGVEGLFNGSFIGTLSLAIIVMVSLQLLGSQVFVKKAMKVFSIVSIVIAIVNILNAFGFYVIPWEQAKSALFTLTGNSIVLLSIFLATALSINLGGAMVSKLKYEKFIFLVGAISSFVAMFLFDVRSGWLVSVVSLVILFAFSVVRVESLKNKIVWAVPVFLALAVLFIFVPGGEMFNLKTPSEISLGKPVSLDIVRGVLKDRPILGSGPETFSYDFAKYKTDDFNSSVVWSLRFDKAGTEFLHSLATVGIVGTLSFFLVMVAFVWTVIKGIVRMKEGSSWVIPVSLFSAWSAVFLATFLYSFNTTTYVIMWMLMALTLVSVRGEIVGDRVTSLNLQSSERARLITAFAFLIVLVAAVAGFYFMGRIYVAEVVYSKNISNPQNENELAQKGEALAKALSYNSLRYVYSIEHSKVLTNFIILEANKEDLDANKVSAYIDATLKAARYPLEKGGNKDVLVHENLGRIYSEIGAYVNGADSWSVEAFLSAIELDPRSPILYLELSKQYVKQGDRIYALARQQFEAQNKDKQFTISDEFQEQLDEYNLKAEDMAKKAIELKSNYVDALVSVAQIQDRLKKFDDSLAIISKARLILPENINILYEEGRIKYNKGDKLDAEKIFLEVLKKDDKHQNAIYSLGIIYESEGERNKAIAQYEKLLALSPENEQIKLKLEELKSGGTSNINTISEDVIENE